MIHPAKAPKKQADIRRAVAHVSHGEKGTVTVVTPSESLEFSTHYSFLDWLTNPASKGGCGEVWLTPGSLGWDIFIPALLRAGYRITPSKRSGFYAGLKINKPGHPVARSAREKGRTWNGRSAAGMALIPRGLTEGDQCRATWEQLQELEEAIRDTWHGVGLGPSTAAIGINVLQQFLSRPLGCSKEVTVELRARDAYAGGRIELFCNRGRTFAADYHVNSDTGEVEDPINGLGPWEVDIRGAYATAMLQGKISGEFTSYGSESQYADDCTISTAVVEVPDWLLYPPLRYKHERHIHYPTGFIAGTWTCDELRVAESVGCSIRQIHTVYRFADRGEEFSAFAQSLIAFRAGAKKGSVIDSFAKSLAVQTVGALASKPRVTTTTTTPKTYDGAKWDRPGIYEVPSFKPSEREVLSAASSIVGRGRAWMGLLLSEFQRESIPAIYVHTDGVACLTDPTFAIESIEKKGGPPSSAWKIEPLHSLKIWAPNRRVTKHYPAELGGPYRTTIASGGITKDHSLEELEAMMQAGKGSFDGAIRSEDESGWTKPRNTLEFDSQRAERIALLVSDIDFERAKLEAERVAQ